MCTAVSGVMRATHTWDSATRSADIRPLDGEARVRKASVPSEERFCPQAECSAATQTPVDKLATAARCRAVITLRVFQGFFVSLAFARKNGGGHGK